MSQHPPEGGPAHPDVLMDRYELGELLGYGGMAEVHRGRDLLLERDVAIKLLPRDQSPDPEAAERLQREAKSGAVLNHPNVVAVHDIGLSAETVFIVMEYLDGEPLRALLAREGPTSSRRAASIGASLCSALEAAHERELIHRDISPANIMVCSDGTPKVMDFGIARLLESGGTTATGNVLGTPAYLSPEQGQGAPLDGRSDLYSLGCCLYEMVTGHQPFAASTPVAVVSQHVREPPRPPREHDPTVSLDLETVILRSMAKHPDGRYATATAMKAALEEAEPDEQGSPAAPKTGSSATRTLHAPDPDRPSEETLGLAGPTRVDDLREGPDPEDTGLWQRRLGVMLIVIATAAILSVVTYLVYDNADQLLSAPGDNWRHLARARLRTGGR